VPAAKYHDAPFLQVANRAPSDERLGDRLHRYRRLHARVHAVPFDGGLQRERVNHRREHAHIIGGGVFDARRRDCRPAHDVPAADHHRGLHAQLVDANDLAREVVNRVGVQADPLLPGERLPAEFNQHPSPARRRLGALHGKQKYT
jgi:hypothetical protein